jgi:hypothetical protein
VRFVALQSLVSVAVGTYWVSPSRHDFSSSRYSMPGSPPLSIDRGLSLSCAFRSLQSSILLSPAAAFKRRSPFLRFLSPSRHECRGPFAHGFPAPIYVSPSAFLTLSTNYSSLHLWTCFIPLPRPRFHFRGFPRHPAGQTFDLPYLPVVNVASDVSPSRSSPMCRSVVVAQGIPVAITRSPLAFQLPRVFLCTP